MAAITYSDLVESQSSNRGVLASGGREENRWLRDRLASGNDVDDISDLDLSYTPPLGSSWDAVPPLAQSWAKAVRLQTRTWYSVRAAVMRMNLGGLVRCA